MNTPDRGPIEILGTDDMAPIAVWPRLCEGEAAPWLDEIGSSDGTERWIEPVEYHLGPQARGIHVIYDKQDVPHTCSPA